MLNKRNLWISAVVLVSLSGPFSQPGALGQTKAGTNPPVITRSYMVENGRYGEALKVYLEANDPDGDIVKIATVVEQVGYGRYPTDWLYLKPKDSGRIVGYLQWNTFSSKTDGLPEWTQITIRVSIFDKAGNESNVAVFPFTFVSERIPSSPVPPPFHAQDLARLGYIDVNLFDPTRSGPHEPPIP